MPKALGLNDQVLFALCCSLCICALSRALAPASFQGLLNIMTDAEFDQLVVDAMTALREP